MVKVAVGEEREGDILSPEEVLHELRYSKTMTPARMVELLHMLPPSGVTQGSADIIRELRGPLPGAVQPGAN